MKSSENLSHLKQLLLQANNRRTCNEVLSLLRQDQIYLKLLTDLIFSEDRLMQQRGLWPLYIFAEESPEALNPYLQPLVSLLQKPAVHPSIHRNTSGIFQYVALSDEISGSLMDAGFNLLTDPATPVATKVNCITILNRFTKIYPEIRQELIYCIEENSSREAASFRARVKMEKLVQ